MLWFPVNLCYLSYDSEPICIVWSDLHIVNEASFHNEQEVKIQEKLFHFITICKVLIKIVDEKILFREWLWTNAGLEGSNNQ